VSSELTSLPALELGKRIRAREVSAEEACRAHLERAEATEAAVGAYLCLDPEASLERARRVDARLAAGEQLSPLAGVPVAIKDTLCTKDQPTTCASEMLAGYRPPHDARVVERLRAGGALPFGKTNCDEFAFGSSTEFSALGRTANPWNLGRVPGGSSGGSAASVAARSASVGLGSDTGGSVRQPAAFCGLVGFKPSYGRVSRHGLVAFASSLDQVGPLTRTVADAAALFELIAGHDELDASTSRRPLPDLSDLRAGRPGDQAFRFGVPAEALGMSLAPDVLREVERGIAALERAGGERVEVELPHVREAVAVYQVIATAEASSNLARFDGVRYGHRCENPRDFDDLTSRSRAEGFGPEVKRRILLGTFVLSAGHQEAYFGQAERVRALITGDFESAFDTCDLILTPTTPTTAFGFDEKLDDPLAMYLSDVYTVPANLARLPALSLPCGLGDDGLPCCVQLIAPRWREDELLRFAQRLEAELGFDACGASAA